MSDTIVATYRSRNAPQRPAVRGPGQTVQADEVGLVNPFGSLITQEDANGNFNARITALEDVTVIDGGVY